jgi:hypothetical protein
MIITNKGSNLYIFVFSLGLGELFQKLATVTSLPVQG